MIPTRRIITLLLILQFVSTVYLWTVNGVGTMSEARFAVFLAVNLLSFSTVTYVYTHDKWEETISRGWILAAALGLAFLLLFSLYFS
ncbi:MAG: hypothetical protein ACLP5V_15410 [Candidatus Bathyarchaeia archaeon]